MKGSRVASRIVIAVGLAVVFGIGVSIIMLPALQGAQSRPASNAPAAATSSAASDLPAPQTSAAARDAAAAPPDDGPKASKPDQ
jgi:flagellar basal body-associated protein FliL